MGAAGEGDVEIAPDHAPSTEPLISVRSASKTFHMAGQSVRGLFGVDLDIRAGETVGLVGESGSGKTTLARVLMGIIPPDEGAEIQLDGHDVAALAKGRTLGRSEGTADRLPEPRLGAEPPPFGAAADLALAVQARRLQRRRAQGAAALAGGLGAAARALSADAPVPALRRTQAARGDRPRLRRRSADRRLRRADLGAGRLGPGGDPQPADRPAADARRSPTCSSATTSGSCATWPTGSSCCTSAA